MQKKNQRKIKVLIVDDSFVSQKLHRHIIESDPGFEIAGIAIDGREAVSLTKKLSPDVISMDLDMPRMDGLEATRTIMQETPLPIVVVSSLYDPSHQELAIKVLEAGAVTIMPKPFGPGHPEYSRTSKKYVRMLKSMSQVKVVRRRPGHQISRTGVVNKQFRPLLIDNNYRLIVIGASAGGPEGLKTILAELDPGLPVPILIVQHIDRHFVEGYHIWLQSYSKIPILIAAKDQVLLPGHAYLAPADKHLILKSESIATLSGDEPVKGHRPSVGHLFRSAGEVYKGSVIAVILSGMGSDGVPEMKGLKDTGALTIAQDEATSLIFGMPGEAVRSGAATNTLSPEDIAKLIVKIFNK